MFKILYEISFDITKFNDNFKYIFQRFLCKEYNETNFDIFILVNKYINSNVKYY